MVLAHRRMRRKLGFRRSLLLFFTRFTVFDALYGVHSLPCWGSSSKNCKDFCPETSPSTDIDGMKCAIYARVSTDDQQCQLQLTALRRYAASLGWETVEYIE
jgi:hypothetical protein